GLLTSRVMQVRVLGSAAGGGFPQWNCACAQCSAVRAGDPAFEPRTQDSLAVSRDGKRWLLLNASPDITRQIQATPALFPRRGRETPIAAIALSNGDLDHCLGLLNLRESQPLAIYATVAVLEGLCGHNAFFRTLERHADHTSLRELGPAAISLEDPSKESLGLMLRAVPVPGKLPLHLVGLREPSAMDNVALVVREEERGPTLLYVPGIARNFDGLGALLDAADCVFFDATFWSECELSERGVGASRARDMAHWPLEGPEGSLAVLSTLRGKRIFLTHVNNTNPILRKGSPERDAVESAGLAVAHDGLEVSL
ncbi:MAG TPA: pyrroloquinoline quinone biosynthesis protein PqqB, partial [Polyangiaceae bacterium]|nr:pyrroloquinoline quinone biosynthesis protein PqqB [Polyangiaceae bacterium]